MATVLREKEEAIKQIQRTLKWRRNHVADLGNKATPGDKLTLRLTEIVTELVQVRTESIEDEQRLADALGDLLHEINVIDTVSVRMRVEGLKTQIKLDGGAGKSYA